MARKDVYTLPYGKKLNDMLEVLFQGFARFSSSSADYTATLADTIIQIAGNKKLTVPAAASTNDGKIYIVYFSENAKTGGGIVDNAGSPATIVAQALCLNESSFLLVSNGRAWTAVPLALGQDA